MPDAGFALTLVIHGALTGLMYALIALGFVLIYKATEVINFAQGELVMLAAFLGTALTATGVASFWLSATAALVGMVLFGFLVERVMLRNLAGRPVIAVIMATIGLAAILRGAAPLLFGAETRAITPPLGDAPVTAGMLSLPPVRLAGALVSLGFLAGFGWFFLRSRTGIALRALADDQRAAMAMGINAYRYFALAWGMAGVVATLGGIAWGTLLGVDVHLALVGLKVFPVVILGGLDSIVGAIVGGVIVGVVESVAAGYLDPVVGGGTKDLAPYVLMIVMLLIRPYGLFGTRTVRRI